MITIIATIVVLGVVFIIAGIGWFQYLRGETRE